MKGVYLSKIAAPRFRSAVLRERLFRRLDSLSDSPVTWISSPAGSGKTTLIASYLRERNIPALWYRVDEGDSDVATFFYYMAEAAKTLRGKKNGLPLFSPDFRPGIEAFTRHYFNALYAKMRRQSVLVFDNYQDAPRECEFHEVMRNGLRVVPEGIRVIVASRNEAPAPFVSLKADGCLSSLDWEDLRFTVDEVGEMLRFTGRNFSEEAVQRIYDKTDGWAAAVILMMDEEPAPSPSVSAGTHVLFDYLAVEVFRKLDHRTKDFLCTTAFLSSVPPAVASELTAVPDAGSLLAYLSRNHYFTSRHGAEYFYHPLFRDFLKSQARDIYGADTLRSLQIRAAHALIVFGKVGDAVQLLLDAQAPGEALPLIIGHARQLLTQGRMDTLEEWAGRLPEEMQENTPWLVYWRGIGKLVVDPPASWALLEKAFVLFEGKEDRAGLLLSVAGIMNAIFFTWDDCHPFDRWIEWVDRNVPVDTIISPLETEIQVATSMICALTWRQPFHPNGPAWARRALNAAERIGDPVLECAAEEHAMEYYRGCGDLTSPGPLACELNPVTALPSHASPIINLTQMLHAGYLLSLKGLLEQCIPTMKRTVRLAEETGLLSHLGMIYFPAIVVAFETGDYVMSAEILEKMERVVEPGKRHPLIRFLNLRTFGHLASGRITEAARDGEHAIRAANDIGMPLGQLYCNMVHAYVLRRMGRHEDTRKKLQEIEEALPSSGTSHHHYLLNLVRASLLLDEGRLREGHEALRKAFGIGREKGYAKTLWWYWQREEMGRLCQEALTGGIEVEYAKALIRTHQLAPVEGRPEDLVNWPWPVMIRTLGWFDLNVCGSPPSKSRRKPLDLLKALISLGGEQVRQESVEDLLWPEAEGDMARISFKTTLSRLRKIIGEKAIDVKDGKVTLNPKLVWVDLWAFESLAERVSQLSRDRSKLKSSGEIERLGDLVLEIYRGDFLASDDEVWIDVTRKRLASRCAKTIERLGQMLTDANDGRRTETLYERAIERGIGVKAPTRS